MNRPRKKREKRKKKRKKTENGSYCCIHRPWLILIVWSSGARVHYLAACLVDRTTRETYQWEPMSEHAGKALRCIMSVMWHVSCGHVLAIIPKPCSKGMVHIVPLAAVSTITKMQVDSYTASSSSIIPVVLSEARSVFDEICSVKHYEHYWCCIGVNV